jgi:polo-like kinase 1
MVVKIGDFGLATSFSENQPGSLSGTPNYIAPEVLAKKGHSISSEVWSIGCMVYALLCGAPPFETESVTSTYQLISNCDYKIPPHLSLLAVEFIQSMLTENPDYRGCLTDPPPTSDSLNLQSHPFLVEGFTPATLPCSALNTTPVFTDSYISTGLSIPDKRFSSAVNIPTQERSESSTGCGSFSPLFSPLGSKVKGFFTTKKKFLDQAIAGLTACLAVKKCDSFYEEQTVLKLAPVFISKWVDYSNKFGFGFQMSDGSVGVLFNDKTKIGCSADSDMVQFTDLNGKTFSFHWDENANQPFPELSERVDILKYYMQYMDQNLADSITFLPGMETVKTGKKTMVPQMSIWSRHGDCVVMEMTNNMVQINHLSDHIKVVIWGFEGNQLVTIISTRSSQTYSLAHPCPLNIRSKLENTLKEMKEMSKKKATEGNI